MLRGARRALAAGLVCVLVIRVNYREAFSLQTGVNGTAALALELRTLLRDYSAKLVDSDGEPLELDASGTALAHWFKQVAGVVAPSSPMRTFNDVVAWHEGAKCRNSLATAAARALLGGHWPPARTWWAAEPG